MPAALVYVGLSLKAFQPAAAWYFIVIVYRFSPGGAKKRGCPLGDEDEKSPLAEAR
jgi:hypothetical protein